MIIGINDLSRVRHQHQGQKLVLTSGTFDLLHVGHLHYLAAAKKYGEVLVVLLSGDRRIKARKGDQRPIIPEVDRAEMLDALKTVDYVLIDPALAPPDQLDPVHEEVVKELRPDFYVTDGPDPRFVDLLPAEQFIVLDRVDGGQHGSTSAIIEHIQSLS